MTHISLSSIPERLFKMYYDFVAFAFSGRIFVNNFLTMIIMSTIVAASMVAIFVLFIKNKAFKRWYSWLILLLCIGLMPFGANTVLLMMSPAGEYHLVMRLQWVIFLVAIVVISEKTIAAFETVKDKLIVPKTVSVVLVALLCYNFLLMDNIAYFNMQQQYEKSYAYCVRLLDRIEQTPGYVQGMPICMVGEISEKSFPQTELTYDITSKIRGTDGSFLFYRGEQYEEFIKNYLGATLNILEGDYVVDMYYSEEYSTMSSFPDKNSIKIVNGIMFIKLE